MKNTFFNEITFSIILVVLALLFLDPFMFWMPDSLVFTLLCAVVIIFAIFVGLLWRERARDERDELHKMIAGRVGYIAGAGVLVVGLIWQTLVAHPDPWLVAALVGMVVGKLAGLLYGRMKR